MTYVTVQPCVDVKDRTRVDECSVDCIYEGARTLYINPLGCVDCGAREVVRPTEAIFYRDDLLTEWEDYLRVNQDFFDDIGTPGGASSYSPVGKGNPVIAALPPMN